jgi:hypothetical protein
MANPTSNPTQMIVVGSLMLFLGCGILWFTSTYESGVPKEWRRTATVYGVVTEEYRALPVIYYGPGMATTSGTKEYPVVQYEVGGQTYETINWYDTDGCNVKPGKSVPVAYNPDKPAEGMPNLDHTSSMKWVVGTMTTGMMLFAVYMLVAGTRQIYSVSRGFALCQESR